MSDSLNSKAVVDPEGDIPTTTTYFTHYQKLLQLIATHSTRLTIALKPPYSKNTTTDAKSVLDSITKLAYQLVSHTKYLSNLDPFPGECLCSDVKETTNGVLAGLSQLITGFIGTKERYLIDTGLVWDICDIGLGDKRVSDLARSNKSAVYKRLKSAQGLVRDAVNEMKELAEDDGDEDPFLEEEDNLTLEDKRALEKHHVPIVSLSVVLLRMLSTLLAPPSGKIEDSLASLQLDEKEATHYDHLYDHFKDISLHTDDYVAALSPPQDKTDVKEAFEKWSAAVSKLASALRKENLDSSTSKLLTTWQTRYDALHDEIRTL